MHVDPLTRAPQPVVTFVRTRGRSAQRWSIRPVEAPDSFCGKHLFDERCEHRGSRRQCFVWEIKMGRV